MLAKKVIVTFFDYFRYKIFLGKKITVTVAVFSLRPASITDKTFINKSLNPSSRLNIPLPPRSKVKGHAHSLRGSLKLEFSSKSADEIRGHTIS